jgi:predicted AAA+ superfamily ATPase
MVAHYHANLVNYSELGRSLNLSDMTIRKYLQILENSFMVRLLKPWHENISKRQVKNLKVYIRDSGILHALLGIDPGGLSLHPKVGASWEGFALEEVIRLNQFEKEECYFWRTHDGAELDLLVCREGKKVGFEFKYNELVKLTPSMRFALEDLKLEQLTVVTPGERSYLLSHKIHVKGIQNLLMGTGLI